MSRLKNRLLADRPLETRTLKAAPVAPLATKRGGLNRLRTHNFSSKN
jgi:hypothetical protein